MLIVGLTGSIGMGKSTTAEMLRAEGVPVFDSDAAVHAIYNGPAAPDIEASFPGVLVEGVVDRHKLATKILDDPQALRKLENVVHPLVRAEREKFLANCRAHGDKIAVLDIPLLFETGAEEEVDAVVVVSAPAHVQRARVLARPNMTKEKFAGLLDRQVPDAEKRRRADFIVHTDRGFELAREEVRAILRDLRARCRE